MPQGGQKLSRRAVDHDLIAEQANLLVVQDIHGFVFAQFGLAGGEQGSVGSCLVVNLGDAVMSGPLHWRGGCTTRRWRVKGLCIFSVSRNDAVEKTAKRGRGAALMPLQFSHTQAQTCRTPKSFVSILRTDPFTLIVQNLWGGEGHDANLWRKIDPQVFGLYGFAKADAQTTLPTDRVPANMKNIKLLREA